VVFQVDYGEHEHVFSDLQRWYRKKMDVFLLGEDAFQASNAKIAGKVEGNIDGNKKRYFYSETLFNL